MTIATYTSYRESRSHTYANYNTHYTQHTLKTANNTRSRETAKMKWIQQGTH
jgi:hypothetical protein